MHIFHGIKTPKNYYMGLIPSLPDFRDRIASPGPIDPKSDLRNSFMPPIWDQQQLGSCVAHGVGAAYEYELRKQGLTDFMPARLDIYYWARYIEGSVDIDAGCEIRDAIKGLARWGVCDERNDPYDITQFRNAPSQDCQKWALSHLALQYENIPVDNDYIRATLTAGSPVVIGVSIYESFESSEVQRTGLVPMPLPSETLLGGHCMLVVGHDDNKQLYTVRQSWGLGFGDNGYIYMPYSYVGSVGFGSDYWKISLVS